MTRFARTALFAFGAVLALSGIQAQAQTQATPTSGELLQQIPSPPQEPLKVPDLTIEPASSAPTDTTIPFMVERIAIEGNTVFGTATLHALVDDKEGQNLTLAELNNLVARITAYYHNHGHPLTRAVVPAQTLSNGTVRVQVIEARYDQVQLDNRGRVNDKLLHATLAPLQSGDLITQSKLDRTLLLLGDLPGVQPRATLLPGTITGTSTLAVQADPGPTVSGHVSVDNAGNRYTGRTRLGAWMQIDNPLRHGDQLSIGALTGGEDLLYGRLGYQITLNGHGTRLGGAYSVLDYGLGNGLEALRAHGTAEVSSAWLSQPLLRNRRTSIDAKLQVDGKNLRDRIDSVALYGERHTTSATFSLDGQHRTASGVNRTSLSVTHGELDFDDSVAAATDAGTAGTAGSFTLLNASISRLQFLNANTHLYLVISGQHSDDNLDSSEQFLLGGQSNVRGYAGGASAGVSGYLATVELRRELDWLPAGRTLASLFFDHGGMRVNAKPWTTEDNHIQLQSAGVGLQWSSVNQWNAQLQVAAPVGSRSSRIAEDDDVRGWVQISKGF